MNRRYSHQRENDPCTQTDWRIENLLNDFTLLRIHIDRVELTSGGFTLEQHRKELFGVSLEYTFPCPKSISQHLSAPMKVEAKSITSTSFLFKHRNIRDISLNEDIIPFWNRSSLRLNLVMHFNTRKGYVKTPLAHCVIPLKDLLQTPFIIDRDFDFVGMGFEGFCQIKIDLFSRIRSVMEKIEQMRSNVNLTFNVNDDDRDPVPHNARVRSTSRCHSRSEEENRSPTPPPHRIPPTRLLMNSNRSELFKPDLTQPFRQKLSSHSNRSDMSDSVFEHAVLPRRSISHQSNSEKGKCDVQLTVHSAYALPLIRYPDGSSIAPSAYISVLGRDGHLRSSVCERTRRPQWNWTARFSISRERGSLMVKIVHSDPSGDTPIGYVRLDLPLIEAEMTDFEMINTCGSSVQSTDAPIITMSVACLDSRDSARRNVIPIAPRPLHPISSMEYHSRSKPEIRRPLSPEILESREELERRVRKDLEELDGMKRNITKQSLLR